MIVIDITRTLQEIKHTIDVLDAEIKGRHPESLSAFRMRKKRKHLKNALDSLMKVVDY